MIGQTLSHFEITSKLGEGGMGEVYRGTDTKLGRDVAIKVLPEAVANDPDRLARFEREAKVLASLNHPSIAAIYSLESTETTGTETGRFEDGGVRDGAVHPTDEAAGLRVYDPGTWLTVRPQDIADTLEWETGRTTAVVRPVSRSISRTCMCR